MQHFLILFFLLLFSLHASEVEWRINELESALDKERFNHQIWQYGWSGVYGTVVAYDTASHFSSDSDTRYVSDVDFVITGLGLIDVLANPLAGSLSRPPIQTFQDRESYLHYLETELNQGAAQETELRSLSRHLILAGFALAGGMLVADHVGDDEGKAYALSMLMGGEMKILTTPTGYTKIFRAYYSEKPLNYSQNTSAFNIHVLPNYLAISWKF